MFEIPGYLHERVSEVILMTQTAVQEVHEAFLAKIREASLPSEQERRRYALLQAAATLTQFHVETVTGSRVKMDIVECVRHARHILAEIERQEMQEEQQ